VGKKLKKIIYGLILLIGLTWMIHYILYYKIELSELKEVNGILKKNPKFDSNRGKYLELVIYEDDRRYHVNGIGYHELDIYNLRNDLKKGLPVTILVSKSIGINEFLDGIVGVVDFYGLKANNKIYLDLNNFNKGLKNNRFFGLIIWFVFFGTYIYSFWIKDKVKSKRNT